MKVKFPFLFLCIILGFAFKSATPGLMDMIGEPVNSPVAKTFIAKAGAYEEDRFDDSYYFVFKPKGFDLMMTMTDTIETVFVFAKDADGHKRYKGELPFGLSLAQKREDIEKLLGIPDVSGGDGVIPYYSGWNEKGIGITYQSLDTSDMQNKIHHISFSKKIR